MDLWETLCFIMKCCAIGKCSSGCAVTDFRIFIFENMLTPVVNEKNPVVSASRSNSLKYFGSCSSGQRIGSRSLPPWNLMRLRYDFAFPSTNVAILPFIHRYIVGIYYRTQS